MTVSVHEGICGGSDLFCITERFSGRIVDLYDFVVFSSLLLSFECVAMAYISCIIQQVPWSPMTAIIPFLAAFSIYNLNRKTDEDEDAINRKDRFAFTKRYEKHLYGLSLISLVVAMAWSATAGVLCLLATAAPFICGFLYSFRVLPKSLGYSRFKEIPAVKNITVGFAWASLLAFLPLFLSQGTPDSRTVVTFVLFFMWGFMASLIPDIRDREGDASSGVMTIPVICGKERTRTILSGVLLVLGIPLILYSSVYLSAFTTSLVIAACIYSHGCAYLLGRPGLIDLLSDAISDGQYISFALVIATMALLWP